jgi:hypothetical protein
MRTFTLCFYEIVWHVVCIDGAHPSGYLEIYPPFKACYFVYSVKDMINIFALVQSNTSLNIIHTELTENDTDGKVHLYSYI